MHDHKFSLADANYAANLRRIHSRRVAQSGLMSGVPIAFLREYLPDLAGQALSGSPQRDVSSDYFVFFQEEDRWKWRRMDEAERVVETSRKSFRCYEVCAINAKRHGWAGKSASWFLKNGVL